MVPGDPALSISTNGFITVTPTETGLYVFSVKAEEFRNGIKIGESRRDFQMLVVDGCNPPDPPEALVKVPGQLDFYKEDDTIVYVASQPKCFDLFVTDDIGTNVSLNAIAVNFGKEGSDLDDIFSFSEGSINSAGDTLKVEVCVSDCPYVQNEPYLIDLIAADDACPLPQRDTVRVTIIVEPPTNQDPFFVNESDTNYINIKSNGKFGVIAPYSKDFCKTCNRLRITAKGELRLCLFGNTGISIRHLLQKDDQTEELQDLIMGQMKFKKESHYLELGETGLTKNLSTTGG